MFLFLGSFDYAMDERGRVPLPPSCREELRKGIVLSQGSPDRCLLVRSAAAFDAQASEYMEESPLLRKGRDMRLAFFSTSHPVELDSQHRILIPAAMRAYAGLSGKVKLVGAGECLQIWAPDAYDARMDRINETLEHTLETRERRDR